MSNSPQTITNTESEESMEMVPKLSTNYYSAGSTDKNEHTETLPATASHRNTVSVSIDEEELKETFGGFDINESESDLLLANQTSHRVIGQDGVFSNMAAKPHMQQVLEPPSYNDIAEDMPPTYFENTVTGFSEDGEVLIEGFPVGDMATFMSVSWLKSSICFYQWRSTCSGSY
jgi:Protein of unknown function (DUF2370)